jgi:hypothetical protein
MRALVLLAAIGFGVFAVLTHDSKPAHVVCSWTLERDTDGEMRWYTDCGLRVTPRNALASAERE